MEARHWMRYSKRSSGNNQPEDKVEQGRETIVSRLVRLSRLFFVGLAFAGLLLFVLMAWGYVHATLYTPCVGTFANLDGFGYTSEPVTFQSEGDYPLRGWFVRGTSHPEYAVIVIYGHSANTVFALPDALTVLEAGYSVLIYEHRVCAEPGRMASTGYYESLDASGAITYLAARDDIEQIAIMGFSEGGTASLLAASRAEPGSLSGVIGIGGYSDIRADVHDEELAPSLVGRFFRGMILVFLRLYGLPFDAGSPIQHIDEIDAPVLLIYGSQEVFHGQQLLDAAGDNASLVVIEGAGHGGYRAVDELTYESAILAYLQSTRTP